MAACSKLVSVLVGLLFGLVGGNAFAGFAQVSPPSGYSAPGGVSMYKAATNDVSFTGGVRGASGVINVAGRSVTMPAAYRFAANAGGAAARSAFGNPYLFIAIAAGTAIYDWYNASGYGLVNGQWVKMNPYACYSNCYEYLVSNVWYPHMQLAANAQIGKYMNNGYAAGNGVITSVEMQSSSPGSAYRYKIGAVNYTSAWYGPNSTRARAVDQPGGTPAVQSEFEAALSPKAIPAGLPQMLPDPLPILSPVLNPSADAVPVPVPMRVPQGLPVPVPDTNPQQYKTPVIDLVPVPDSPWMVDAQPKEIIKTDATPLPMSEPVPSTPPAGQTATEKVTPDLCEKNPGILACQTFKPDELTPTAVPNTDRAMSITQDSGWGQGNGSCPAPRSVSVAGMSLTMPFTLLCDFAQGIRPVVIALAWLTVAMGFIGFARKD